MNCFMGKILHPNLADTTILQTVKYRHRNILHTSWIGERKAPDNQINLQIKCKEWKDSNAEDFIFYRVCKFSLFCNFKLPFNSVPRAKKSQTTIE